MTNKKLVRPRIAQHALEKEIMALQNKGESLQGDYNRLRSTVAALTRKQTTIHLTRQDLEDTVRELSEGAKMLVTQHPEGDGLILSFSKDGSQPTKAIVKAGKIGRWERFKAWFALRFHYHAKFSVSVTDSRHDRS